MQPIATQNLITVSGFKARNPEIDLSSWNDTTVSGIISTATRSMLNYCNVESFLTTTVSGELSKGVINNEGSLILFPRVKPVQSIQSITMVDGGITVPLTLSGSNVNYYQIPYPYSYISLGSAYLSMTGLLVGGGTSQLMSLKGSGFFVSLNYTAGYTTTPEDLQDACDLWVRDICLRRMNPIGAQEIRQGTFTMSRTVRSSNPRANIIDSLNLQAAKQLLDQGGYTRSVIGV